MLSMLYVLSNIKMALTFYQSQYHVITVGWLSRCCCRVGSISPKFGICPGPLHILEQSLLCGFPLIDYSLARKLSPQGWTQRE